jgi:hypothetical protein
MSYEKLRGLPPVPPLVEATKFNSSALYFVNIKFEFCGRSIIIQAYVLLVKVKIICVF